MQHKWSIYYNSGERKLPELVEEGTFDLACSNPDEPGYDHTYAPGELWDYLYHNVMLYTDRGLYLSLVSTEAPTADGKRWYIYAPQSEQRTMGSSSDEASFTTLRWNNIKTLEFWNSGFRDYTRIYQAKGVVDYSLFVSRCFGYCFLVGQRWNEDAEDVVDFTNFYPSIHHYHNNVMIAEESLWQPIMDANWMHHGYDGTEMEEAIDEPEDVAVALDEAVTVMSSGRMQAEALDLADILQSSVDMLGEDDEELSEDELAESDEMLEEEA